MINVKAIILLIAMVVFNTGCEYPIFKEIDYADNARTETFNFANQYYALLKLNEIVAACIFVVKNSRTIKNTEDKCIENDSNLFSIVESLGSYIEHSEGDVNIAFNSGSGNRFGEAIVYFIVSYEFGTLIESFHVGAGRNVEAYIMSLCYPTPENLTTSILDDILVDDVSPYCW